MISTGIVPLSQILNLIRMEKMDCFTGREVNDLTLTPSSKKST